MSKVRQSQETGQAVAGSQHTGHREAREGLALYHLKDFEFRNYRM